MKKTNDIKIKKIEVTNKQVVKHIVNLQNDKICPIWSKNPKKNFEILFWIFKKKIAYISFAFMSLSIASYIFLISSTIVLAVQERSYIFSINKINLPSRQLDLDLTDLTVNNFKNNENITFLARTNIENSLSIK